MATIDCSIHALCTEDPEVAPISRRQCYYTAPQQNVYPRRPATGMAGETIIAWDLSQPEDFDQDTGV